MESKGLVKADGTLVGLSGDEFHPQRVRSLLGNGTHEPFEKTTPHAHALRSRVHRDGEIRQHVGETVKPRRVGVNLSCQPVRRFGDEADAPIERAGEEAVNVGPGNLVLQPRQAAGYPSNALIERQNAGCIACSCPAHIDFFRHSGSSQFGYGISRDTLINYAR